MKGAAEPVFLAESRRIAASRVLLESPYGWRWYLGERVVRQSLRAPRFISPGPLPPRASFTEQYTRAELARFTVPSFDLGRYQRPEVPYREFRRRFLAGPLGVEPFDAMKVLGRKAGMERRAAAAGTARKKKRSRTGEGEEDLPPPAIPWMIDAQDADGEQVVVQLKEPQTAPSVTGPVCNYSQ